MITRELIALTPIAPDGSKPNWDEQVSAGIEDVKEIDSRRWTLGWRASQIDRSYGEGSLKKYAYAINISYDRLYSYQRVYSFYGGFCTDVENLSWSHYREAMRIKGVYLTDQDALEPVLAVLTRSADRDYSVEKLGIIISRWLSIFHGRRPAVTAPPSSSPQPHYPDFVNAPVMECEAIADSDGQLHLSAAMDRIRPGMKYIVRVYEVAL